MAISDGDAEALFQNALNIVESNNVFTSDKESVSQQKVRECVCSARSSLILTSFSRCPLQCWTIIWDLKTLALVSAVVKLAVMFLHLFWVLQQARSRHSVLAIDPSSSHAESNNSIRHDWTSDLSSSMASAMEMISISDLSK